MSELPPIAPMFDVPLLLEASEPKPRVNWFWYGVGAFLLVSLVGAYISETSTTGRLIVEASSVFLTIGIIGSMSLITMFTMRRVRESQMQVEAAGELVQLRRWPQAGVVLTQILSQPTRTHAMRFEALLYLTSVLARYERFDDAITVQDHLLESNLDPNTERAIKLARAMAMLRLDRLFDADRAIADLRRGEARDTSGGLALIEIYRDVKTGHPAEAIETFDRRHDLIRDQLGHRAADAWVLVAKAHDQLDHVAEAQRAFTNATLLAAVDELARRYPEVKDLAGKYAVAALPAVGGQKTKGKGAPFDARPHPNLLPEGEGTGRGDFATQSTLDSSSGTPSRPPGESRSEGDPPSTPDNAEGPQ